MTCRKNVTHQEWIDDMVNEFEHEYKRHAGDAMKSFLDCIFEILMSSKGRTKPYQEEISKLGTRLKSSSVIDDKKYPHHRYIMRLLEIGLLRRHSHMFILSQINKETLLNNQYYCSLILAAKLYALGKYDEAINYAEKIGQNCSLALYICGQSYRKIGDYAKAHAHLQQGINLLGQGKCGCPFTGKEEGICNEDLLKAVLFRARAVVFRKQKEFTKAEECYKKAEEAVNKAMKNIKSSSGKAPKKISLSGDNISVEFGEESSVQVVTEVAADVYFSFGYYYYNQRNYDQAEKLFEKSIKALEASQVDWDSPYTRLAIVKFCQGKYREANELFAKAEVICKKTIRTNREASLSLALCVLGCKLTNDLIGQASADNPMDKLEDAINQAPRLTLGPLECHLDDAKHFFGKANELSSSSRKLVEGFINRIEREISRIKSKQNHNSKIIKVFISYAHEGDMREKVKELADWLRERGVQPITDHLYENKPPEIGWPAWMQQSIEDSDLVLVVCTKRYKQIVEKRAAPKGGGRGVAWEGAIITDHLYQSHMLNKKFYPILPEGGDPEDIPRFLKNWWNNYVFPSDNDRILALIEAVRQTQK